MRFAGKLVILILLVLMFFPGCSSAAGSFDISLQEKEWTWNESDIATFSGIVSFDELPCESLVLRLQLTTDPVSTNCGEVVFQTVNEKKLTLRKQQPEYILSPGSEKEFSFIGNWKTPDNVFFTKTEILFQIYTDDGGSLLAEKKLTVHRDSSELANQEDGRYRLKVDFSKWTNWALIAAGILWILAIGRIIWNYIRNKKER